MTCPTLTTLHAILAAHDAPCGPSKADTLKAVAACLSGACAHSDSAIGRVVIRNKGGSGEHKSIEPIGKPGYSSAELLPEGALIYAQPVAAQGGITISATAMQEIRALIANLAAVVRVQNGNLHEDTNSLLTHADKAIAILAAKGGAQ